MDGVVSGLSTDGVVGASASNGFDLLENYEMFEGKTRRTRDSQLSATYGFNNKLMNMFIA